jgi:hypothetical protein
MDLATIVVGADRFEAYIEELTNVIGHADQLHRPSRKAALASRPTGRNGTTAFVLLDELHQREDRILPHGVVGRRSLPLAVWLYATSRTTSMPSSREALTIVLNSPNSPFAGITRLWRKESDGVCSSNS